VIILKHLRYIFKLVLTTDLTDAEIAKKAGASAFLVYRIRQKTLIKRCDWQKIKAMSDQDFMKLLLTKCPRFAQQVLSKEELQCPPKSQRSRLRDDIWERYRSVYS